MECCSSITLTQFEEMTNCYAKLNKYKPVDVYVFWHILRICQSKAIQIEKKRMSAGEISNTVVMKFGHGTWMLVSSNSQAFLTY